MPHSTPLAAPGVLAIIIPVEPSMLYHDPTEKSPAGWTAQIRGKYSKVGAPTAPSL